MYLGPLHTGAPKRGKSGLPRQVGHAGLLAK